MSPPQDQSAKEANNETPTAMEKLQNLLATMRTGSQLEDTNDTSTSSDASSEKQITSSSQSTEKQKSDSKYRVINMATRAEFCGPYEGTEIYHPLDLILAIKDKAEIAHQVEEISFISAFNINNYNGDGTDNAEYDDYYDTESERDTKIELAWPTASTKLQAFNLDDTEEQRWIRALQIGNDSAYLALLLCMVPNLRVLRLGGNGCCYQQWLDVAFQFARSNPEAILSKLTSVDVQHNDCEGEEDFAVLEELIFLPSMRNISADMMDGQEWKATIDATRNQSNVERVEIQASGMWIECMLQLLSAMRNPVALDFAIANDVWDSVGCSNVKEFREKFDEVCGVLLAERGLVWRAGVFRKDAVGALGGDLWEEGFMIRCAELEHELETISTDVDK